MRISQQQASNIKRTTVREVQTFTNTVSMHCGTEMHWNFLPQINLPLHFNPAWDIMERDGDFKQGNLFIVFGRAFLIV